MVRSIDYHTIKISKYFDNQLQPHVKEHSSYAKESAVFIRKSTAWKNFQQHPCNHQCTFSLYKYSKQVGN